jgi:hypothetical protein
MRTRRAHLVLQGNWRETRLEIRREIRLGIRRETRLDIWMETRLETRLETRTPIPTHPLRIF